MVYIFVDLKANFSTAQHPKVKMGQRVVGGGGVILQHGKDNLKIDNLRGFFPHKSLFFN